MSTPVVERKADAASSAPAVTHATPQAGWRLAVLTGGSSCGWRVLDVTNS
ncbi:hypothetical protein [Dermacoccus barathri]